MKPTKKEQQSAGREQLKERYPDIYDFIVKLEEVFGPVSGKVTRKENGNEIGKRVTR